jgi:hypothetical protein
MIDETGIDGVGVERKEQELGLAPGRKAAQHGVR